MQPVISFDIILSFWGLSLYNLTNVDIETLDRPPILTKKSKNNISFAYVFVKIIVLYIYTHISKHCQLGLITEQICYT